MWKKIAYGGLLAVLIYFLYAVFFKKIDSPAEQMKKEMKAKKVVYKLKDDAIIYADEQIGSNSDKIIKFKNVIVDLIKKEMLISGKEGEINTETSDITLTGKVVGSTKDNKWNLYTEKVDYKKEGDLQLAWCYALIDEKEKAKEYFENVDKDLGSSLEKDEELKKDYNTVNELINSTTYIN